jgi:hypothetical protein
MFLPSIAAAVVDVPKIPILLLRALFFAQLIRLVFAINDDEQQQHKIHQLNIGEFIFMSSKLWTKMPRNKFRNNNGHSCGDQYQKNIPIKYRKT